MATNPFSTQNPFGGGMPKKDKPDPKKQQAESPFELTGDASRDHVRKTFWEIFSAEANNDGQLSNEDIVRDLETQIFEVTGENCKSKEYRDMTKAIQLKLRGTRYADTRNLIRDGTINVNDVCTDDFINSKTAPSAGPKSQAAQPAGAQPIGRGRGLPAAGRGRGGPPMPGLGRGRGMPPMMGAPARAPARPASSMITQEEKDQSPKNDEKIPEQVQPEQKLEEQEPKPLVEEPKQSQQLVKPARDEALEDRPMQIPPRKTPMPPMQDRMRQIQMNDTTQTEADQSKVLLQFDDSIAEPTQEVQKHDEKPQTSSSQFDGSSSSKRLDESRDAPNIQASLDDSQENTSHHLMPKKKKKKKKKDRGVDDMPVQQSEQIMKSLEAQIQEEQKHQEEERQQLKVEEPQSPEIQVVSQAPTSLEIAPIVQNEPSAPEIVETQPEETPNQEQQSEQQVSTLKEQSLPPRPPTKASIGKLTKQNLDNHFKGTEQQFNLPDIETETIIVQESPRQSEEKQSNLKLKRKNSESKNSKQHFKTTEQLNPSTIKSLTHSQLGAQESENIRRLQEALHSKKEINAELNQKIMMLEQEQTIKAKRQQLIAEENAKLKEQIRELRDENQKLQERSRESQHDTQKSNQTVNRQVKDLEEVIAALTSELEMVKHERDTYRDRFQRSLRDSQTQREQMERSINNQSLLHVLANIRGTQSSLVQDGSSLIGSASNQQEINLQKEITELKSKYEKQLREQRHELIQRTRDLQKVERKNVKYRENNRVLSEAVQGLENRNTSMIAGSGGVNQDPLLMYEHVLRETNEDLIENMDFNDDDNAMQYDDVIQPRNRDHHHERPHNESSSAGPFNQVSELNSGEMGTSRRAAAGLGGSGYFENQDEATGGESHYNVNHEEEKVSNQQNYQYTDSQNLDQQASSLIQDSNLDEPDALQNNNQSTENNGEQKGIVKQAFRSKYMPTTSAVQQVNQSRTSDMRDQSQLNENSNENKNSQSDNSDNDMISGEDDQTDSQYNDDSGDSQDSQDEMSQMSNEYAPDMNDEGIIGSRVPGAGSGNQDMSRNQMGHIGPGAIQQNQNMGQRNRQTGSNVSGNQRYNHGNMPHQMQQHNQQYNMGSSGAQGINYSNSNEIFASGTGSGGAAGEAGSSNKTAQRRNRRGYRQQNQQPSSGANDRDLNRRQNRNNRQGRQDGQEGGRGGMNNGNSQSYEDSSMVLGVDNRGRPTRTSNRGRQQNNQQQQTQQIHNREGSQNVSSSQQSNQVASQGQATQLQPEPVSLSQEREQQQNNQNKYGAARQQQPDNSQAVQQVLNNLTNYNSNIPASTQSHAQFRTHGAAQSSSMMPASSASHNSSGYPIQMINPGSISASAPHGGPHGYNGVVHTAHQNQGIHFDSGSTSHNPNQSQSNQQISQRQPPRPNRQGGQLNAQTSSSPSTQVVQQRQHQSNDQQNAGYLNIQPDLSGPGAVGAPPSICPPATQSEHQQQNVSPGSQVNSGQGQQNRNQPTVASVQSDNLQQSVNTIPASVFGAGSGGGMETSHSGALQTPGAALGAGNSFNYGGSGDPQERTAVHQISVGGSSLFEDQQFQTINFNNVQDNMMLNRNNDSRKTSGANTPSKDGAITPKTQQQHHGHSGGAQTQQTQEFNSAVSVGLNNHLNSQSNQQNYIHNLIGGQSSMQQDRGGRSQNTQRTASKQSQNVSIIDQLSAAAQQNSANNYNPMSFLDELTGGPIDEQQEDEQPSSLLGENQTNLIPNNMFD